MRAAVLKFSFRDFRFLDNQFLFKVHVVISLAELDLLSFPDHVKYFIAIYFKSSRSEWYTLGPACIILVCKFDSSESFQNSIQEMSSEKMQGPLKASSYRV